jgi:hypothetical protein
MLRPASFYRPLTSHPDGRLYGLRQKDIMRNVLRLWLVLMAVGSLGAFADLAGETGPAPKAIQVLPQIPAAIWSAPVTNDTFGLIYRFGVPATNVEMSAEVMSQVSVTIEVRNIGKTACRLHTYGDEQQSNAVWFAEVSPNLDCFLDDKRVGYFPIVSAWPGDRCMTLQPGQSITRTVQPFSWQDGEGDLSVHFYVVTGRKMIGNGPPPLYQNETVELRTAPLRVCLLAGCATVAPREFDTATIEREISRPDFVHTDLSVLKWKIWVSTENQDGRFYEALVIAKHNGQWALIHVCKSALRDDMQPQWRFYNVCHARHKALEWFVNPPSETELSAFEKATWWEEKIDPKCWLPTDKCKLVQQGVKQRNLANFIRNSNPEPRHPEPRRDGP